MSSPVPSPGPAAITSAVASRIISSARLDVERPVHLGQRQRHELGAHRRDDRDDRRRRGDGDEPGAGAQRGHRRQVGGAGAAERAGDDEDAAVVALVGVGLARLERAGDRVARDHVDPRPVERFDDLGRDADLDGHDVAAERLGRRQDVRQLGRGERHRQVGFDGRADDVRRCCRTGRSAGRWRRPAASRRSRRARSSRTGRSAAATGRCRTARRRRGRRPRRPRRAAPTPARCRSRRGCGRGGRGCRG